MAGAIVAGAAVQAIGGIMGGNDAQQAADYNASIKNEQANSALAEGAEQERRQRIESKKQIGGERAAIAASGIKNEGSALDILQESASNAELDALTIRHQAQLKAWGLRSEAAASTMEGQAAKTRSYFGAAGSLLSGAGEYTKYQKQYGHK